MKTPLERAAEAVKTSAKLAEICGVTAQAVSQWTQVPVKHVLTIERETGIPRHDLRPDIYPPPRSEPEADTRPCDTEASAPDAAA